jgi:hypothetical protein
LVGLLSAFSFRLTSETTAALIFFGRTGSSKEPLVPKAAPVQPGDPRENGDSVAMAMATWTFPRKKMEDLWEDHPNP